MCTTPCGTTRFSPRFLNVFFRFVRFVGIGNARVDGFKLGHRLPSASSLLTSHIVFFLMTAPLRGPFRVRALVLVRWPRTGRLRR